MKKDITTWKDQGNVHIDLVAQIRPKRPYHDVISDLAIRYSKSGDSILDIGCGRGQICELISKKGDRTICIADAYKQCLEETASIVSVSERYLISEECFNIKQQVSRKFKIIIMSHVLEHTLNPAQAVKDVMSLLDDEGYLILAVPNPARPSVLIGNLFQKHYVCRGHVYSWDMSHWINFLENILNLHVVEYEHDFVQIKGCDRFPIIMKIGIFFRKLAPWWSFSNIAVIKKR